ncbi:NAD-dependent epimerase [Saliterribacillus persicus]|uniref:UDP-glucuronate 4-epimerase n=1 Tax=Saliterribacillus persicus TaxID=930114 RepID=A0A368YGF0_9BACI|nr:NAD-dependent epimerase [Saliterribacillus persicus]RCW77264.1 UDP-glucuronate 4-epimerase [Saliterribacillus persicus]
MTILVTGAAGFIGMHVAKKLLEEGKSVIGIDNLNEYYDPKLKKDRVKVLKKYASFTIFEMDICDDAQLMELFRAESITEVIHLAAQPGVRYSIENPKAYIDTNITGFIHILEACRHYPVRHLIFASSSSVYGLNTHMPFSPSDTTDHPVSLYAATKKSNEMMAHSYSHLYDIPVSGLRFFTVYGPYGRPDMAYFSFVKRIVEGQQIQVFNKGEMERDFTYIDDITTGIVDLLPHAPSENSEFDSSAPDSRTSLAKYRLYNIGNNQPVKLLDFIHTIEQHLNKKADIEFLDMQAGDVKKTYADIDDLKRVTGFQPKTNIEVGLEKFIAWYKVYYKL